MRMQLCDVISRRGYGYWLGQISMKSIQVHLGSLTRVVEQSIAATNTQSVVKSVRASTNNQKRIHARNLVENPPMSIPKDIFSTTNVTELFVVC